MRERKPRASARSNHRDKSELETWYDTAFLPLYPGPHAHTQRKTALSALAKIAPENRPAILEALKAWKRTPEWLKDGGAYVPGPGKFFANKMQEKRPPYQNGANGTPGSGASRSVSDVLKEAGVHE